MNVTGSKAEPGYWFQIINDPKIANPGTVTNIRITKGTKGTKQATKRRIAQKGGNGSWRAQWLTNK